MARPREFTQVLVVDDDELALNVAGKVLEAGGYEAVFATDGEEAFDILRERGIRIVLSDWNMPNLDGASLCRRIRASFKIDYVYFILVTTRNSKDDLLSGLDSGADDFITKPFEPAELLARLNVAQRILGLETSAVTIFSLAKLAESKDSDTGNHLERIRAYSKALADTILLKESIRPLYSPGYADLIYQTSPLHDIGKVGIPDSILLKPARLSDNEFAIMKQHTEIGADTLHAALKRYPRAEFLRLARDIAWAHHERWDGTGYPRGLRMEGIPLGARIVALADVYDALTTRRVYKAAFAHDVARAIILEGKGTHFDPLIVDVFLEIEDQCVFIKDSFED